MSPTIHSNMPSLSNTFLPAEQWKMSNTFPCSSSPCSRDNKSSHWQWLTTKLTSISFKTDLMWQVNLSFQRRSENQHIKWGTWKSVKLIYSCSFCPSLHYSIASVKLKTSCSFIHSFLSMRTSPAVFHHQLWIDNSQWFISKICLKAFKDSKVKQYQLLLSVC